MTPAARLRFWLEVLAAAPRHSEAEAHGKAAHSGAIRKVDEMVERVRRERKHG